MKETQRGDIIRDVLSMVKLEGSSLPVTQYKERGFIKYQ